MVDQIAQKIKYLEERKKEYRDILKHTLFSKEFMKWMKHELLGEKNYTREKLEKLGVPSFMHYEIMKQEKINNDNTFSFLMENIAMQAPYSTNFMKKIHTMLLKNIMINPGEYRRQSVRMFNTVIKPLPPTQIAAEMEQLERYYRKSTNPIRAALDLNYKIIVNQPFADGNKRVARLLMNYELMKKGYCPLFVYREDRNRFLDTLENRFRGQTDTAYYHFMLTEMEKTMERSISVLENKPSHHLKNYDICMQEQIKRKKENLFSK